MDELIEESLANSSRAQLGLEKRHSASMEFLNNVPVVTLLFCIALVVAAALLLSTKPYITDGADAEVMNAIWVLTSLAMAAAVAVLFMAAKSQDGMKPGVFVGQQMATRAVIYTTSVFALIAVPILLMGVYAVENEATYVDDKDTFEPLYYAAVAAAGIAFLLWGALAIAALSAPHGERKSEPEADEIEGGSHVSTGSHVSMGSYAQRFVAGYYPWAGNQ